MVFLSIGSAARFAGIALFVALLSLWGADVVAQCPASAVVSQTGVVNAAAATGPADGVGAELYDVADELRLEMPHTLAAGDFLKLALRRKNYGNGGTAKIRVSTNAIDVPLSYVVADDVNVSSEAGYVTITIPVPGPTRFVRLAAVDGNGDDFLVDAVWTNCPPPPPAGQTCLNVNGDFAGGLMGWTLAPSNAGVIENAGLVLNRVGNAFTSAPVTAGRVYELAAYAQSNDGRVRVEFVWYNAGGTLLSREDAITMTPRMGSKYTWTVRAPTGAASCRTYFHNLDAVRTRIDDVCFSESPLATPPVVGCLNPRSTFADGSTSGWESSKSSEIKFKHDKEDDEDDKRPAIEISKEYVRFWTDVPARGNGVYQVDMTLLGEDAGDKRTHVTIEWLTLAGVKLAETKVLDGQQVGDEWTDYARTVTAPNNPLIVSARLVFETRTSGKTWINRACVAEVGLAGASASISGGVFEDRNKNGRWDSYSGGDPWVEDVLVILFRDNGDGVQQPERDEEVDRMYTTAADGYSFAGLAAGKYFVLAYVSPTRQLGPTNAHGASSDDVDNDFYLRTWRSTSVGWTDIYTLSGSNAIRDVDMGMTRSGLAAVVGYIWADTNGDSYRNEPVGNGLNGITVRSVGTAGTLTTETTFGPDGTPGYYVFNYVQPQTARIEFARPSGTTLRAKVGDNTFNPDGRTDVITLSPDNTIWNRSAALAVSGVEVCGNGIDDDLDGKIDDFDADCSVCTVPEQVLCGDDLTYYMPPVWAMAGDAAMYSVPAYLRFTTAADLTEVRIRTQDGSFNQVVTVSRNSPREVLLPTSHLGRTAQHNLVQADAGFIITSPLPIEATYYLDGLNNKEIITLKGHHALGNRFRAGSQVAQHQLRTVSPVATCSVVWPDTADQLLREAHFVSAMASESNTRVTFTWDPARFTPAGGITSPHTVTLNRGQTYLIRDNYTNQTVSGILVQSDKAIAVVSGSQHTAMCESYGRDAGIDQLVPTCYLGSEYAVTKHPGLGIQHYAIVVADVDGTQVTADGSPTVLATLRAGEWFRYMITGAVGDVHLVRTSRPAYVFHLSGISQSNNEVGMAIAAAVDQCSGNKYLRFLRGRSGEQYLSLTTATAALADLRLNGVRVSTLAGVTVRPVPGKPTLSGLTVPQAHLLAVNELTGRDYFQAALLIAIDDKSGLFGYLTAFAPTIDVLSPSTNRPAPRYRIPTLCAGEVITHNIAASSCQGGVQIISISNNTSLGTVTQTGPLALEYRASTTGGGDDLVSVRLRDASGLETSVCINLNVCGPNINIAGLPESATLTCSDVIPTGSPSVVGATCPMATPITYADVVTAGACANEYRVRRTWSVTADCGFVVTRTRDFIFVDQSAPVFATIPADIVVECNANPPVPAMTATDLCDPAPRITYRESACGQGESPAYYKLGGNSMYLAEVTADPRLTYPASFQPLALTSFNTYDPNVELRWRVRNSNPFPVYFRYEGHGATAVTGHFVAPANVDLFFFTPRIAGPLKVHYYDHAGAWRFETKAPSYAKATIDPEGTCGCTTVRTWTATDVCGNVRTVAQRVHYVDRTAPVLSDIPSARTICTEAEFPTDVPDVADNCGAATAMVISRAAVIGPGLDSTITRTFTVTDACGNSATASQTIRKLARPVATVVAQAATCGANNGSLTLNFADNPTQSSIQFSRNGMWAPAVNDATGSFTFANLAPGTYALSARWGGGGCPVALGTHTVANHSASLGATQVYNLATGAPTITLADGGTYHLGTFPASWNVRTGVTGAEASVRQRVSGASTATRTTDAPAGFLPAVGTPAAWGIGTYTLQVEAFAKTGGTGPVCQTQTITFRLITNEVCDNGLDDDGDGLTDCDDPDCGFSVSTPAPQTICSGTSATVTATPTGGRAPYTYAWNNGAGSGSSRAVTPTVNTTYTVTVTDANGCVRTATATVNVTPTPNPGTISASQTGCVPFDPAPLTGANAGAGVTYQWQIRQGAAAWSNVSTSQNWDPGWLTAETEVRRGVRLGTCDWQYSNTVTLTPVDNVVSAGTIAGDEDGCPNFSASVIASASAASGGANAGGTVLYQWQQRPPGGGWNAIVGATAATYNPGNVTATTEYRRAARRAPCGTWQFTGSVTKTVIDDLTAAGAIAGDQDLCGGYRPSVITSTALPSGGSGGTIVYRWQVKTTGAWAWLPGTADAATYAPDPITETTSYRRAARRVDDKGNNCAVWTISEAVTKTVTSAPTDAGAIAGHQDLCGGYDPGNITSTSAATGGAGGNAIDYQWQQRTTGGWSAIVGATGATYDPGAIAITTEYRRGARRQPCNTDWVFTDVVTKAVSSALTDAGTIAGDQYGCAAFTSAVIASTSPGSGGAGAGAISYQWQARPAGGAWAPIAGAIAETYNPGAIGATTEYRRAARRMPCASWVYSAAVVKEVAGSATAGGTVAGDEEQCGGYDPGLITSTAAAVTDGTGTPDYRWQESPNGTGAWAWIAGATSATLDPGPITATTYYRRTVRSQAGNGGLCGAFQFSNTVVKTVAEAVADGGAIAGDQSACGSYDPSLITSTSAASGGAGNTAIAYGWQSRTTGTWSWISGATELTYDPGVVTTTTQYRRFARRGTCGAWAGSNTVTKTVHDAPVLTASPLQTICLGEEAPLTVVASGGRAPYTFAWTGGPIVGSSTTAGVRAKPTATGANVYTVTVRDANGCQSTATAQVNLNSVPQVTVSTTDPASCGSATGSVRFAFPDDPARTGISFSLDGGATWLPAATNAGSYTASGLRAGNYDLRTRWGNGDCPVDLGRVTLADPSAPVAAITVAAPDRCENSQIAFTAADQGAGATYAWDFGPLATPRTATGRSASARFNTTEGVDNATVTLAVTRTGCTATATQVVTIRTNPTRTISAVVSSSPTTCGGADGSVTFTAPDPSGSCIRFSADGGATWTGARTITGLAAGTYTLSAQYCNGECTADFGTFTIAAPTPPTVSAGATQTICDGATATLVASPAGGKSPYTYTWSGGAGTGATASVSPSATTDYTVTVRDAAGCTATATVRVVVNATVTSAGTISGDQDLCGGYTPSPITNATAASGGTSTAALGYQWQARTSGAWSDIAGATGPTYAPTAITQTTEYRRGARRSPCATFAYSNTVTKAVTTPVTTAGTISGNQDECGTYTATAITSATVASGGSGSAAIAYQWERKVGTGAWTPITGATAVSYDPGSVTQTTDFRRVALRSPCTTPAYSNVVTKAVTVGVASAGVIAGDQDECGTYTATAIGSTGPASGGSGAAAIAYQWERKVGNGAWASIAGATGLTYTPGSISQTTDFRRGAFRAPCTSPIYSNTVTKAVTQALTDGGEIGGDQTQCGTFVATAIVSVNPASGGTGAAPISYRWEQRTGSGAWTQIGGATAETYAPGSVSQTVEFRRIATRGACATPRYSNVVTKTVIVSVSNGGTIAGDEEACGEFGAAVLTSTTPATGGTAAQPITYQWERKVGAGTWQAIASATGDNYAPGTVSQTTQFRRGARRSPCAALEYSNTVTKSVVASVTVAGVVSGDETNCGSFAATPIASDGPASGGTSTAAISYQWERKVGTGAWTAIAGATAATYAPETVTQTSEYRRAALRGPCATPIYSNTVTKRVNEAPSLTVTPTQAICLGESTLLTATPTGGRTPYTYDWSGGATVGGTTGATVEAKPTTVGTFDYAVTVRDANGCSQVATVRVNVKSTPRVTFTTVNPAACGASSGKVVFAFPDDPTRTKIGFSVDGGATWVDVNDDTGTHTVSALPAGSYDLRTRWTGGECPLSLGTVTLSDPGSPAADFAIVDPDECDGATAGFTAVDQGVGAVYTWNFGPGATPRTAGGKTASAVFRTSLGVENIPVTLTVARLGCTASLTKDIRRRTSTAQLISAVATNAPSTCGGSDGNVSFTAPNPVGSCMQFSVDGGTNWTTDRTITGLAAGVYTLESRYCNGECREAFGTFTIAEPAKPVANAGPGVASCAGAPVSLVGSATGGRAPYTYAWSNGATTATAEVSPTTTQTYTLTVRDAGGCASTSTVTVSVGDAGLAQVRLLDLSPAAEHTTLTDGIKLHVSRLPANWNIGAVTSGTVGSVSFDVPQGTPTRKVDNTTARRYPAATQAANWRAGVYDLRVRAYTAANAAGDACADETIRVIIEDYEICDNGIDDDGDGKADCDDDACQKATPVRQVGRE